MRCVMPGSGRRRASDCSVGLRADAGGRPSLARDRALGAGHQSIDCTEQRARRAGWRPTLSAIATAVVGCRRGATIGSAPPAGHRGCGSRCVSSSSGIARSPVASRAAAACCRTRSWQQAGRGGLMNWEGARNTAQGFALVGMARDLAQAEVCTYRHCRGVTEAPF
jgi:hypothetical protein